MTEEALSGGRTSEAIAGAAIAAGIGIVQVREKEGSARRALEIALALRAATREHGALLLVNDRLDLALAADADGVHLGQDDLPVAAARAILGPDALIGLSITDPSQLVAPDVREADYLGVGAVFPTASKADARYTGLELLAAARAAVDLPIVAIGGITEENAATAIRAGADVLAVISAIAAAPEPGPAARRLLDWSSALARRPRPAAAARPVIEPLGRVRADRPARRALRDRRPTVSGSAMTPRPGRRRSGTVQVATTDMLVEGVHFRLDWTSPEDLGWKALAVNLSDLAAMGATPGRALISIAVDPARRELVTAVARGLQSLAGQTGTQVVGGDTVRSPGPLVINVALVGEAHPGRLLRRDAARPGDLLAVTGRLGASAAALACSRNRLLLRSRRRATPRRTPPAAAHGWPRGRFLRRVASAARSTSATGSPARRSTWRAPAASASRSTSIACRSIRRRSTCSASGGAASWP